MPDNTTFPEQDKVVEWADDNDIPLTPQLVKNLLMNSLNFDPILN